MVTFDQDLAAADMVDKLDTVRGAVCDPATIGFTRGTSNLVLLPSGHTAYGPHLPDSWPSFCLFAVAGLTSIVLVHAISLGNLGAPGPAVAAPARDSPELIPD